MPRKVSKFLPQQGSHYPHAYDQPANFIVTTVDYAAGGAVPNLTLHEGMITYRKWACWLFSSANGWAAKSFLTYRIDNFEGLSHYIKTFEGPHNFYPHQQQVLQVACLLIHTPPPFDIPQHCKQRCTPRHYFSLFSRQLLVTLASGILRSMISMETVTLSWHPWVGCHSTSGGSMVCFFPEYENVHSSGCGIEANTDAGNLAKKPTGAPMSLPAGGSVTVELACNKAYSS